MWCVRTPFRPTPCLVVVVCHTRVALQLIIVPEMVHNTLDNSENEHKCEGTDRRTRNIFGLRVRVLLVVTLLGLQRGTGRIGGMCVRHIEPFFSTRRHPAQPECPCRFFNPVERYVRIRPVVTKLRHRDVTVLLRLILLYVRFHVPGTRYQVPFFFFFNMYQVPGITALDSSAMPCHYTTGCN